MSNDDSDRRILSRKALAKEQRRAAYQKAKERRDSDPRYLAMKQQAKEQRRAAYQKLKERRKAEADTQKRAAKRAQTPDDVRTQRLQAKYAKDRATVPLPTDETDRASADPEVATSVRALVAWLSKGSNVAN